MRRSLSYLFLPVCAFLSNCATTKSGNPSFDLTKPAAREAYDAMSQDPQPLERPLLIVGGFFDPGFGAAGLKKKFSRITTDPRVAEVSFSGCRNFDACADRLFEVVDESFPNPGSVETIEVDVVGLSMGGLVARYAALPRPGKRRLKIHRLFTISCPHRGADLASLPTNDELRIEMRPGSETLEALDAAPRDYEIFPYTRLKDSIVGTRNSAPVGEHPWWLVPDPLEPSHFLAYIDIRILAEISSRLQGSGGFATTPRTPLPENPD